MYRKLLQFCLIMAMTLSAKAQNNVGINTTSPNASAALDVQSTSQGILIPRMSSAARTAISSPAKGLMVFDSSLNAFYFHNGTGWTTIGAGPTLQVYATRTTPFSLGAASGSTAGSATTADLPFNNTITAPSAGAFDSVSFTANTPGLYLVTVSVNAATYNVYPALQLLLNGSPFAYAASYGHIGYPSSSNGRCNLSMLVPMVATDKIRIQILNTNTLNPVNLGTDGSTKLLITKLN